MKKSFHPSYFVHRLCAKSLDLIRLVLSWPRTSHRIETRSILTSYLALHCNLPCSHLIPSRPHTSCCIATQIAICLTLSWPCTLHRIAIHLALFRPCTLHRIAIRLTLFRPRTLHRIATHLVLSRPHTLTSQPLYIASISHNITLLHHSIASVHIHLRSVQISSYKYLIHLSPCKGRVSLPRIFID
jgi:hypothetical protein